MNFTIRLQRPPFEVEFESGSIGEAVGILQQEDTELSRLFGISFGEPQDTTAVASGTVVIAGDEATPAAAKRGRKPKGADPANASAPPPAPIPSSPPAPPVMIVPGDPLAIPPGLQRDANNQAPAMVAAPQAPSPAAAPPPPPLMPAAPPIAPTPPVQGPLGVKVVAELERRGADDATKTQLSDWLASVGLTIKGATFEEAIACVRCITDDKLGGVATALNVVA